MFVGTGVNPQGLRSGGVCSLLSRFKTALFANRKLFVSDLVGVVIAGTVALVLSAGPHFSTSEALALLRLIPMMLVISVLAFVGLGFYRRDIRSCSLPDLTALLPGTAVAVLCGALIGRGLGFVPEAPMTAWPIMWLTLLPLVGASRLVARRRELLRHEAGDSQRESVLLVGIGATADLFLRATEQGLSPYRVMGVLDTSGDGTDLLFHSVPILGTLRDLEPVLARLTEMENPPRSIFLTGPVTHFESESMATLVNWAEGRGIKMRSLPNLTDPLAGDSQPGARAPEILPEDILPRPQKTVERALLRETYQGRRVLVTGAGGSIGSELVRQLASLKPAELILIENSEFNAYQIDRSLARHFPDVPRRLHMACIRDRDRINAIFRAHKPELVFNAAALKHVPMVELNPCEGVLTNVIGSRNVSDAAREVGARAMVQVSTDKAVNTTNVMGATKRVGEFYAQAQDLITREIGHDTRFFAVRFGNVLGSSGSLIPLFQEQIARGGPLTVTDPRMERYFMTIREAVELTLVAAANGLRAEAKNGRIFVLDMGQPVRIVDMAERMIRMAGKVPGEDIKIDFIGIRPGEKLFEELFDRAEEQRPAGFAGVNCAIPNPVPISRLRNAMLRLEMAARAGDERAVRQGLADLVPGYDGGLPKAAKAAPGHTGRVITHRPARTDEPGPRPPHTPRPAGTDRYRKAIA